MVLGKRTAVDILKATRQRAEPVRCRYRLVCTRLDHVGATRRIRLNRPWAAAMRHYVKLRWPLVKIQITMVCTGDNVRNRWSLLAANITEYHRDNITEQRTASSSFGGRSRSPTYHRTFRRQNCPLSSKSEVPALANDWLSSRPINCTAARSVTDVLVLRYFHILPTTIVVQVENSVVLCVSGLRKTTFYLYIWHGG